MDELLTAAGRIARSRGALRQYKALVEASTDYRVSRGVLLQMYREYRRLAGRTAARAALLDLRRWDRLRLRADRGSGKYAFA